MACEHRRSCRIGLGRRERKRPWPKSGAGSVANAVHRCRTAPRVREVRIDPGLRRHQPVSKLALVPWIGPWSGTKKCSCPRPDRQCRMAKAREAAGRSGHQVEVLGFDRTRGEAGACEMVGREPGVRRVRTGGMQVRHQTPRFKWNLVPLTLVFLGSPTAALGAMEDCGNPIEVEIRPDSGVMMKFCEIPAARGVLIGSRNGEEDEKPVKKRELYTLLPNKCYTSPIESTAWMQWTTT